MNYQVLLYNYARHINIFYFRKEFCNVSKDKIETIRNEVKSFARLNLDLCVSEMYSVFQELLIAGELNNTFTFEDFIIETKASQKAAFKFLEEL